MSFSSIPQENGYLKFLMNYFVNVVNTLQITLLFQSKWNFVGNWDWWKLSYVAALELQSAGDLDF